jgi:hypothetical protein
MYAMRFRRIVSLFMLVGVLFLLTTSVILYLVPHGRVAYWTGWTFCGLSKTDWSNLHINLGLLLLIAAGLHVYYNWGLLTAYLRDRSKRLILFTGEFTVAVVLTAAVLVGTHLGVPPLRWILDANESIKDAASVRYGEPPYGHAEQSTLRTFVRRLDLDLEVVLGHLAEAGYVVEDPQSTLETIAAANEVTPQVLFEAMQEHPESGGPAAPPRLPRIPPPGTGKKQLRELCGEAGLEIEDVLRFLSSEGIRATPEQTLQEIASQSQSTPDEIYEAIRLLQEG